MVKKLNLIAAVLICMSGVAMFAYGCYVNPATKFEAEMQIAFALIGILMMLSGFLFGHFIIDTVKEEKRKAWKRQKDRLSATKSAMYCKKLTNTNTWTFSDTNLSAKQNSRSGQRIPSGMKELYASQEIQTVKW